jgi:hypothetical protein
MFVPWWHFVVQQQSDQQQNRGRTCRSPCSSCTLRAVIARPLCVQEETRSPLTRHLTIGALFVATTVRLMNASAVYHRTNSVLSLAWLLTPFSHRSATHHLTYTTIKYVQVWKNIASTGQRVVCIRFVNSFRKCSPYSIEFLWWLKQEPPSWARLSTTLI